MTLQNVTRHVACRIVDRWIPLHARKPCFLCTRFGTHCTAKTVNAGQQHCPPSSAVLGQQSSVFSRGTDTIKWTRTEHLFRSGLHAALVWSLAFRRLLFSQPMLKLMLGDLLRHSMPCRGSDLHEIILQLQNIHLIIVVSPSSAKL